MSRSCNSCEANCLCYVFISIQKIIQDCDFINCTDDVDEYFDDTTSTEDDVYQTIAQSCANFIHDECEDCDSCDKECDDDDDILKIIEKEQNNDLN